MCPLHTHAAPSPTSSPRLLFVFYFFSTFSDFTVHLLWLCFLSPLDQLGLQSSHRPPDTAVTRPPCVWLQHIGPITGERTGRPPDPHTLLPAGGLQPLLQGRALGAVPLTPALG